MSIFLKRLFSDIKHNLIDQATSQKITESFSVLLIPLCFPETLLDLAREIFSGHLVFLGSKACENFFWKEGSLSQIFH